MRKVELIEKLEVASELCNEKDKGLLTGIISTLKGSADINLDNLVYLIKNMEAPDAGYSLRCYKCVTMVLAYAFETSELGKYVKFGKTELELA